MDKKNIVPHILRKHILAQSKRANVGHIGSALSIVEIISVLYRDILHDFRPKAFFDQSKLNNYTVPRMALWNM